MRYSAIDKGREMNSGKKTDGHTEVHQMICHLGSPVQKSCTPGSTGGVPRKGHVYQPRIQEKIPDYLLRDICIYDNVLFGYLKILLK